MDNNAIPIGADSLLKTFKRLEPKEVREATEPRDLNYFRLAQTEGRKELKSDILGMVENLDNVVKLENANTISEFGFMVLARDLAKTYLKQVISIVETSFDYVKDLREKQDGQRDGSN